MTRLEMLGLANAILIARTQMPADVTLGKCWQLAIDHVALGIAKTMDTGAEVHEFLKLTCPNYKEPETVRLLPSQEDHQAMLEEAQRAAQ